MKQVRCAIYTRKSSEDGLEQDFNSLHAQREACAAYVLSQASEGWTLIPDEYDDGGLSGGSLVRPALQRLLADIEAGKIDTIVVYKVDRLTRSLLDFAKLVEAFDRSGTSFVSITQSFNTTTSMGRLTLNMLLSFAQFEREVTAERIRDKIAASKAKGMWMGGNPPLGYEPNGRSLAIVEEHAILIRDIYQRYFDLGNVRLVTEQLDAEGIRTPRRTTGTGRAFGDCRFTRGQIYKILSNPIYRGKIAHQGKIYPGQHDAIIDEDTWERAQLRLTGNLQGERRALRAISPSLLAGLIVDEAGEALVAAHACKGKVRYRYYVSRSLHHGGAASTNHGVRIAAREIETLVITQLALALGDPLTLFAKAWMNLPPDRLHRMVQCCSDTAASVRTRHYTLVRSLITQIRIWPDRVEMDVPLQILVSALGGEQEPDAPLSLTLTAPVRLARAGMAVGLIHTGGNAAAATLPDLALVKLLIKARGWWARLASGEIDITTLAAAEGANDSYVSRVVRLAFLAPDIVDAILAGKQRASVNATAVIAKNSVDIDWRTQRQMFLAGG
jgi:site-specific DNA recombinase